MKVKVYLVEHALEHTATLGACADFVAFLFHSELYVVTFLGKLAFVAGCIAVYVMHLRDAQAKKVKA